VRMGQDPRRLSRWLCSWLARLDRKSARRDLKFPALRVNLSVVHNPCNPGMLAGTSVRSDCGARCRSVGGYRHPGAKVLLEDDSLLRIRSGRSLTGGGRTLMGSL
jgi:hypothetical protein